MLDRIQRFRSMTGVAVSEGADAWVIQIPKSDRIVFTITVPRTVLEWFAAATDGTMEMWSDWADYYATEGETNEKLKTEMASDVERFILTLLASPVRRTEETTGSKAAPSLEWERNGKWQRLQLSAV